jgi:3-methyladenine DNA glycosylase AlkD
MTLTEALAKLESLSDPKVKSINYRNGAGHNQFGVKLGDIRAVAKEIKSDHDLGLLLWKTGNLDARLLSLLIIKPKQLTASEVESFAEDIDSQQLADWVSANILKVHPEKASLREKWMQDPHPAKARFGWSLTTSTISQESERSVLTQLLDRIEREMATAHPWTQWTMNYCLAEIGIQHESHRERALAIGEKLGLYRDYPTAKGCVSPFAPIWINEMVKRAKS